MSACEFTFCTQRDVFKFDSEQIHTEEYFKKFQLYNYVIKSNHACKIIRPYININFIQKNGHQTGSILFLLRRLTQINLFNV